MKKRRIIAAVVLLCLCLVCGIGVYKYVQYRNTYADPRYQNTSADRLTDCYEGEIQQITSSVDADSDGIDDQTDILNGTLRKDLSIRASITIQDILMMSTGYVQMLLHLP